MDSIHEGLPIQELAGYQALHRGCLEVYCDGEPTFVVDRAPWLREALEEPKLQYNQEPFRWQELSGVSVFVFQAEDKAFFNNITPNPKNRSERFRKSIFCWNLTIKLFTPYYNHLRKRT